MRTVTILFTLTVAAPAFAQGAPARADGDVLRSCFSPNGTAVSCPVDLVKGRDYLLFRHGDGTAGRVELVNPAGAVTVSLDPQVREDGTGREFRAALTGTFRIKVTPVPEEPYDLTSSALATDCRAGTKTQCAIAPSGGVRGARSLGGDADWYRAVLSTGRTYTFTCDAGYARLALLDRNGRVLAKAQSHTGAPGVLRYRAKAAGAYFFTIGFGDGPYTLTLR
jgi:hypothetical protein